MLVVHDRLATLGRLAPLGARVASGRLAGTAVLLLCGALAGAASMLLQFNLQIPGHAIVRAVVPLALGLSLVPRRGGGSVMTGSAAATYIALGGLTAGGGGVGPGALTSLLLLGPLLDLSLQRVERGSRLLLAFAGCGLAVNAVAFGVRLADKLQSPQGGRPLATWWPSAVAGYLVCGLLAGAVAALLFFRLRGRDAT